MPETSSLIPGPPDQIWAILADPLRWPEWTPTVSRVEALDGPTLAIGRRFRLEQPRLSPAVWTVTELEEGQSFTWVSRTPGVVATALHRLRAAEGDQTRVELAVQFSGPLGWLVGLVAGRLTQDYIQTEAEALAKRCAP